jgi:hypothetical protein
MMQPGPSNMRQPSPHSIRQPDINMQRVREILNVRIFLRLRILFFYLFIYDMNFYKCLAIEIQIKHLFFLISKEKMTIYLIDMSGII